MRLNRLPFVALAGCIACTSAKPAPNPLASVQPMRVVGYLASWGVRSKGTRIAQLPAKDLTHIFYAFGKIDSAGRVTLGDPCVDVGACKPGTAAVDSGGNFAELRRLKLRNPHLKLVVSIGGWTGSGRFSDAALTDSSRRLFAGSAIDVFIRQRPGLFDGLDIDWEFPVAGGMKGNVERPADRENFTLLLAELRRQLDAQGAVDKRHYELAIAASARPSEIANVEIGRIVPLLDFINVMTYDYHSGSRRTGFNSPLYASKGDPTPGLNVDATMRAFLDAGVPPGKLLVGIPFYGRGYGGVPGVNDGLFQPVGGRPTGWRDRDGDWSTLSQTRLKNPNYVRHWDSAGRVPWLYDSTSGTWVSYDDPQSVAEKVRYVRERGLGGVVIWELGGDDGSLILAVATVIPLPAEAQASRPVVAVFAHPDDERIIGPLLSRLAREGRETHLVIATDGSKGIRDFARIPAGAELAAARVKEASCAAKRLGVRQLHLFGLPDGGLASFDALGKLRSALVAIIDSLEPAAIITFGPEGGTGHPDHRLVGNVMTQIIQGDARFANVDLLYASLPTERLRTAPPANPTVNGMAESLLTVRVSFEDEDLVAGREGFACHRTQYSPAEMEAVNGYLAHAWNGTVWLRPWNRTLRDPGIFKP